MCLVFVWAMFAKTKKNTRKVKEHLAQSKEVLFSGTGVHRVQMTLLQRPLRRDVTSGDQQDLEVLLVAPAYFFD